MIFTHKSTVAWGSRARFQAFCERERLSHSGLMNLARTVGRNLKVAQYWNDRPLLYYIMHNGVSDGETYDREACYKKLRRLADALDG